ncbi:serine/threonine-protein kinase [Rhodocyclus purpureus]|uniref:serine/threonine-protein kinase n=1 Tax=Rhodocyclus purpureus TaxID=1067 RepID=UPI0019145CFB|nr:serine/threonine-protein kinase [Rhodocyclus purpureus]
MLYNGGLSSIGAKLMVYTHIRTLGRGAFGRVELVRNEAGEQFALKVFDPSPSVAHAIQAGHVSAEELRRRFASEATYQAQVAHPNVVRVLGSVLESTPPYFVMELAEATLATDLSADPTLGGMVQQVLFDILAGLEGIHSFGIYHRDLKPQNILRLRNPDGSFRYAISDFGLIKVATGNATTLTATGTQGGTERYAAPELITNFKRATARSDIFSFGVILLDIFGGVANRVPYTEVQFPGAVGAVASKCTKSLPARRYSSIAEVRAALYDALQNEAPRLGSPHEEQMVELLRSEQRLTELQWDHVFLLLEEIAETSGSLAPLLRAFTRSHLAALSEEAPDLLAAFAGYYIEYVDQGRGTFDFGYCDVIADKLTWLFELGDIAVRAKSLLAMLGLGTSHNRWFVERRFAQLAGPELDVATAARMITEVTVRGLNVARDIDRLEWSISISRTSLSPALQRLWTPASV